MHIGINGWMGTGGEKLVSEWVWAAVAITEIIVGGCEKAIVEGLCSLAPPLNTLPPKCSRVVH